MKNKVLIIDDEVGVLNSLRLLLRNQLQGWHVEFALGGEKALRILERDSFDVLVTDLRMPHISGIQLLSHAKTMHPQMIRIVLSGTSSYDDFKTASSISHAYLKKPIKGEQLDATIRGLLRTREVLQLAAVN